MNQSYNIVEVETTESSALINRPWSCSRIRVPHTELVLTRRLPESVTHSKKHDQCPSYSHLLFFSFCSSALRTFSHYWVLATVLISVPQFCVVGITARCAAERFGVLQSFNRWYMYTSHIIIIIWSSIVHFVFYPTSSSSNIEPAPTILSTGTTPSISLPYHLQITWTHYQYVTRLLNTILYMYHQRPWTHAKCFDNERSRTANKLPYRLLISPLERPCAVTNNYIGFSAFLINL